ncbi:MAG: hypothetical protein ABL964_11430 [Steroidobacteraceae bacterium]
MYFIVIQVRESDAIADNVGTQTEDFSVAREVVTGFASLKKQRASESYVPGELMGLFGPGAEGFRLHGTVVQQGLA